MKRLTALAPAVPAALLAGLALGPGDVRAGAKDEEKKVEKRVVVRHAGGSWLGVGLDDTEGDLRGAKVRSVKKDSPAEKAGLKEGVVVGRFDGEAVRSASHLARLVGETPAGRSVAIDVSRGGATQKPSATLAEGKRHVRVFAGDGSPGMREFAFEMPEFDIDVPEPPEPPEPPPPPHAPLAPHVWSWKSDDFGDRAFRFLVGGPRKLGIEYMEVEGIEGSGKTTQIQLFSNALEEKGVDHLLTREPGGTPIGDQIRRLVLHPASVMGPWCELLLYAAARAQHLDQVIRPVVDRVLL